MNNCMAIERRSRNWVYVSSPVELEYGPCPRCGKQDFVWSTYRNCIWCLNCCDDIIPEHYGVVDGPVIIECCKMMGISFDAFDLLAHTVIPFDSPLWPNKHLA